MYPLTEKGSSPKNDRLLIKKWLLNSTRIGGSSHARSGKR
jgi:hypothetical protein